jgi:hypothetical protein
MNGDNSLKLSTSFIKSAVILGLLLQTSLHVTHFHFNKVSHKWHGGALVWTLFQCRVWFLFFQFECIPLNVHQWDESYSWFAVRHRAEQLFTATCAVSRLLDTVANRDCFCRELVVWCASVVAGLQALQQKQLLSWGLVWVATSSRFVGDYKTFIESYLKSHISIGLTFKILRIMHLFYCLRPIHFWQYVRIVFTACSVYARVFCPLHIAIWNLRKRLRELNMLTRMRGMSEKLPNCKASCLLEEVLKKMTRTPELNRQISPYRILCNIKETCNLK